MVPVGKCSHVVLEEKIGYYQKVKGTEQQQQKDQPQR